MTRDIGNNAPKYPSNSLVSIGLVLIALGAIIVILTLGELVSVYRQPESNVFINHLVERLSGSVLLQAEQSVITLGAGGAATVGYSMFGFFAIVAVAIGSALIRSGTQLLSPYFLVRMAEMRSKLTGLLAKKELGEP